MRRSQWFDYSFMFPPLPAMKASVILCMHCYSTAAMRAASPGVLFSIRINISWRKIDVKSCLFSFLFYFRFASLFWNIFFCMIVVMCFAKKSVWGRSACHVGRRNCCLRNCTWWRPLNDIMMTGTNGNREVMGWRFVFSIRLYGMIRGHYSSGTGNSHMSGWLRATGWDGLFF